MTDHVRPKSILKLRNIGINTYKEFVIYMHENCHVCRAEGFEVQARVKVTLNNETLIATLNIVTSEILQQGEAALSEYALKNWAQMRAMTFMSLIHPPSSLSAICVQKFTVMNCSRNTFNQL